MDKNISPELQHAIIMEKLEQSKGWNDETHLEQEYSMHERTFYNAIHDLCFTLGTPITKDLRKNGIYTIRKQDGEEENFDIGHDYQKTRGEHKLVTVINFNDRTKAHALLHYSPTMGFALEYGANLSPENTQFGKDDYFGKSIENIITNIASATEGIAFNTHVDRFRKDPQGLRYFYLSMEDFVLKEQFKDAISITGMMDQYVQILHRQAYVTSGPSFKRETEAPLFTMNIRIMI